MNSLNFLPVSPAEGARRLTGVGGIGLMAIVAALASCSGGSGASAEAAPSVHVSPALADVEDLAESAFYAAIDQDWAGVRSITHDLDTSWQAYVPTALADGAQVQDLDAVDAAIAHLTAALALDPLDPMDVAHAANDVCAPMPNLYALYAPTAPPEIIRLHNLDCELMLDGMQAEFGRGARQLYELEVTWLVVRGPILGCHAGHVVARYESALAAMRAAILAEDGQALQDATLDADDEVDGMDGLFDDDVQKGPDDGNDDGSNGPDDGDVRDRGDTRDSR